MGPTFIEPVTIQLNLTRNLDILAVAAGQTRCSFLTSAHVGARTINDYILEDMPMRDRHVWRIEKYIKTIDTDGWLWDIYQKARVRELDRTDIIRFSTERFSITHDKREILKTNLAALRYILHHSCETFGGEIGYHRATIYHVEHGDIHVRDSTCDAIFKYLIKVANTTGDPKVKKIIGKSFQYPILNKIPSNLQCA